MQWLITLGPLSYPLHDAPDYLSEAGSEAGSYSSCFEEEGSGGGLAWARGGGGSDDFARLADMPGSPGSDRASSSSGASGSGLGWSLAPLRREVTAKLKDRQTAAVSLEAEYDLPPDTLFELLADPRQHERIFDAIEAADSQLVESDGTRSKWRLDYHARWSFWKVSGVCHNRLWMWTDRDAGTVTFKLREPGFLRQYEGTWTIKPACGAPMSSCYAGSTTSSRASSLSSFSAASGRAPTPVASVSLAGGAAWSLPDASAAGAGLVSRALAAISAMQANMTWRPMVAMPELCFGSSASDDGLGGDDDSRQGGAAAKGGGLLGLRPSFDTASSGASSRIGVDRPMRTLLTVDTTSSPKISPPYPINQVLKSQVSGQIGDMVDGLVRAAGLKLQAGPLVL